MCQGVTAPCGGGVTVMPALSPVCFRGKENMTVQECVRFIMLIHGFHRVSSQWLLVGAREVGLCVDSDAWAEVLHLLSPLLPGPRWNWSSPR